MSGISYEAAKRSHNFWSGVQIHLERNIGLFHQCDAASTISLSYLSSSRLAAIETKFPSLKDQSNAGSNTETT